MNFYEFVCLTQLCTYVLVFLTIFFSQSVSLTQYVVMSVRLSACPFQLASETSRDVVARQLSDYCPRGAILVTVLVPAE